MPEPIIKVQDLRVVYNEGKSNEYAALRGESLDIYPEEYIILFGPSGCGKSTLLFSILGILQPTSGNLLVKDENVYQYNSEQMVKFQQNTIGIIYQSFNLIPSLTTLDNVSLPLIFAGVPAAERERRAMALLRRFGIEKQAHKISTNLSGGQMQRIAVARSLVNDPEILLADEPVGNLDSVSADEVMGALEEINTKDKKTVILVTHDAKFLPYAHRIYFLKDGGVEREVINPEKKQIKSVRPGTTILTEIEKLARIYPYVPMNQLTVKSIINNLTQDMGFERLEVLERFVELFTNGSITKEAFTRVLMGSFQDGGLEFSAERANEAARKVESVMNMAREVRQYRKRLQEKYTSPKQMERLHRIRDSVLRESGMHVGEVQMKLLDENVASRVAGFLSMEDFRDRLSAPHKDDAACFSSRDARTLSHHLEKVIAQGVHL